MAEESKSGGMKTVMIFVPIFIVQLIAVYFVTANLLLKKVESNQQTVPGGETTAATSETTKTELGKFLYSIDDIIVNPANTKGDQLLLTSIALDLPTEASRKELEEKEIVVKDMVISILASKSLRELGNIKYRDSLRMQISEGIENHLPSIKVNKVYFSKYILN